MGAAAPCPGLGPSQGSNDGSLSSAERSPSPSSVEGSCAGSWATILSHLPSLRKQGRFFLELFSGTAGITEAVQLTGVPVLPPIDIVLSDMVKEVSDVVDAQVWQRVLRVLREGVVFYLHCGTPCNTFSSARKDDGGPPPLRSLEYPMGLPDLSPDNWCLVQLGNLFLGHTCEACVIVFDHGGVFHRKSSVEPDVGHLFDG